MLWRHGEQERKPLGERAADYSPVHKKIYVPRIKQPSTILLVNGAFYLSQQTAFIHFYIPFYQFLHKCECVREDTPSPEVARTKRATILPRQDKTRWHWTVLPKFWFITFAVRYALYMVNFHQTVHAYHRQVCFCTCSGILMISIKFPELEHLKVDNFSRKFLFLNLSKLAPLKPQISPWKYASISFISQIIMKLEQLCVMMYSDYLCSIWLLSYEAVNVDPRV